MSPLDKTTTGLTGKQTQAHSSPLLIWTLQQGLHARRASTGHAWHKAKMVTHPTRSTKRKASRQTTCQRASNRQRAARQQAARSADSQPIDSQPADSQPASQQQPADSKQQTREEQDKAVAAPRTAPLSKATKRKCPPALGSDRPSTRRRVDQGGHRTGRQKRKRRDPQCVTPDRPRTRQRIAERESCDSMQTMRCVPRKLTPCGADAGVPFDPG